MVSFRPVIQTPRRFPSRRLDTVSPDPQAADILTSPPPGALPRNRAAVRWLLASFRGPGPTRAFSQSGESSRLSGAAGFQPAIGKRQKKKTSVFINRIFSPVRGTPSSHRVRCRCRLLSKASPAEFRSAGNPPNRANQRNVSEISRLFDELSEVVPASQIGPWLDTPNPAFEGSTPLQVIERGESDRLWRMIWELRMGNSGD